LRPFPPKVKVVILNGLFPDSSLNPDEIPVYFSGLLPWATDTNVEIVKNNTNIPDFIPANSFNVFIRDSANYFYRGRLVFPLRQKYSQKIL
jgi:hypothetical protein